MDIKVELIGDEIIVTKPGTELVLGYRKASSFPGLVQTRSWVESMTTTPRIGEFLAKAFCAANDKARELGWIV
jgi:hypothetical protein